MCNRAVAEINDTKAKTTHDARGGVASASNNMPTAFDHVSLLTAGLSKCDSVLFQHFSDK